MRCVPLGCLVLSCVVPAQTDIFQIRGARAGDNFGVSVDYAGDVDKDGFVDLIVGIWSDDRTGIDAGAAQVISGRSGTVIHDFRGAAAGDGFGINVSGAGDVNKDGYADVIVGAWGNDAKGTDAGAATVFSGKDGKVLYRFQGDSAGDRFGVAVSRAGDVNKDGYADVIVGAHNDDNKGFNAGMARVFSGVNGAVLYTFDGDSALDYFGQSVGYAGDVNLDGYSDLIVGAYGDDNNGTGSGSAKVFSGRDGKVLYVKNGDSAGDSFGDYVSYAGDVNRDGFTDFIVGATGDDNNGTDCGSARVFSGLNGATLYTFYGDSPGDYFGYPVNYAGDVDNDGHADVIVGAYGDDNGGKDSGTARVLSGKAGSVLFTLAGRAADDDFGIGVAYAGDVDGDGFDEVAVGADLTDTNGNNSGTVYVISGRNLPLRSDRHTISLTSGGTQKLSIDHGSTHGNRLYRVFGSVSGIKPGTMLGGVLVPLNVDPWTMITFSAANSSLLRGFAGKLGPKGTATASIIVPANQPVSALGLTLHHAVLVYDTTPVYHAAGNPVPLTFVK